MRRSQLYHLQRRWHEMLSLKGSINNVISFGYPLCSFSCCHLTYFRICSSLSPTVETQYPLLHTCLPQYLVLMLFCSLNILRAVFPFNHPMILLIECLGGTVSIMCTCVGWILISSISISFALQSWYNSFLTSTSTLPVNTWNRYFGQKMIW